MLDEVRAAARVESPRGCLAALDRSALPQQLDCLHRLRVRGDEGAAALPELERRLVRSDETTDHQVIAGMLDVIRAQKQNGATVAETVSGLLSYRSALYQQRDKAIVARLRAYLFATLADIGVPAAAEPALLDVLAHVDERMSPVEVGAAARAAAALGARGHRFAPYLASVLSTRISEEEFTLAHFEPRFLPADATTIQLEAIRALGEIAAHDDLSTLEALQGFAALPAASGADPRAIRAAQLAAGRVAGRAASAPGAEASADPWITADHRAAPLELDVPVTDQDGIPRRLEGLLDRPAFVVFFYTRCQNDAKCSMTMSNLAFLQRHLAREGLADRVRLLAITYEPQFDTPQRLHGFATDRGLLPGEDALVLQVDPARQQQVIDQLLVPVSYNAAWVSAHGVESSLLDARGRLVRKYSVVLWDNDALVADLKRVLAEQRP